MVAWCALRGWNFAAASCNVQPKVHTTLQGALQPCRGLCNLIPFDSSMSIALLLMHESMPGIGALVTRRQLVVVLPEQPGRDSCECLALRLHLVANVDVMLAVVERA